MVIKVEILAAVAVMELSSVEMPPSNIRSLASGIFFACKVGGMVNCNDGSVSSCVGNVFLCLLLIASDGLLMN